MQRALSRYQFHPGVEHYDPGPQFGQPFLQYLVHIAIERRLPTRHQ
jgi:hypothetical protein